MRANLPHLFGDESTVAPPLLAVAANVDSTQGHSLAYVSDVTLE